LGSRFWWIQYRRNGRVYRESTGTEKKQNAELILGRKLAEIATNTFIEPKASKTTVRDLAADMLQDYRINAKRSLPAVEIRWNKHLAPAFGDMRAANVSTDRLTGYIGKRLNEGASNATINRELAALKRMFSLGLQSRKLSAPPHFPRLKENNVRKGFVDDSHFDALARACSGVGLWLRALLEVGSSYGWRGGELKNLRVEQVDLAAKTIRLEPGETKNREARLVVMTNFVAVLLKQCIAGKAPNEFVFTRDDGSRIQDFRKTWAAVCCEAGLGTMLCPECLTPAVERECQTCKRTWKNRELKYSGLLLHDLRRTGVRNMIRAGVAERVAMLISGHKTRSMLDRYNIVSEKDLEIAARKIEEATRKREEFGHSSDIVAQDSVQTVNTTDAMFVH
jgi:integrase